jgi:L-fucose mutarotase
MLKYKLLHPEILSVLGAAGHGSKILIADGNFQFLTGPEPSAKRVYLNLAPGLVKVTDVLSVLVDAIPIEAAEVMLPDSGQEPPIHQEFRDILGSGLSLKAMSRAEFYQVTRRPDMALVIATGEQRIFANILLTIGAIRPAS